jgi:hypothetical protein
MASQVDLVLRNDIHVNQAAGSMHAADVTLEGALRSWGLHADPQSEPFLPVLPLPVHTWAGCSSKHYLQIKSKSIPDQSSVPLRTDSRITASVSTDIGSPDVLSGWNMRHTRSMADSFPGCAPDMAAGGGIFICSKVSFPAATMNSANKYAERAMNFHWSSAHDTRLIGSFARNMQLHASSNIECASDKIAKACCRVVLLNLHTLAILGDNASGKETA